MSEANAQANEAHAHQPAVSVKRIVRVFVLLSIVTAAEVVWGGFISHNLDHQGLKWVNAIFFLSMTMLKAGYIVAEFMHLRYEITNLIRSVLVPLLLFIWFILAFCFDGGSWNQLRTRYHQQNDIPAATSPAGSVKQP